MQKTGWQFNIWDEKKYRLILVGLEDFAKAKQLAMGKAPAGVVMRHSQIGNDEMEKLALSDRVLEAHII